MCASVARSAGAQQASLPEIPTGQQLVDLTAELDSKLLTAYTTCDIDTFVSMAESHRPGQAQEQASPDLRRTGRAARGSPDWREPERHPRSPALVDAIPPLQGQWGRPRRRPDCVLGDRGYDAAAIRRGLRARHIVSWLAMRRTPHGSGLGRWRWVVERTFAWLNQFRRLRIRYDKRVDIHEAFLSLGCALICWHSLRKTWRAARADAIFPGRSSPRRFCENRIHAAAWGPPGRQAMDIGLH